MNNMFMCVTKTRKDVTFMGSKEIKTSPFKVFGIIFLILLILSTSFVVLVHIAFKNENVTPSLGGYSLYLINDDYMSPKIEKNTLIFATNGVPTNEDIGKVVIADNVKGYGTTAMRLTNLVVENNKLYYELKFDRSEDTVMVREKKIVGIANYQFELMGKIIVLANSVIGYFIFIGVPALLMIICFAMSKHSKTKQIAKREKKREEYQKNLTETEEESKASFNHFVNENEKLNNDTNKSQEVEQFSDSRGSEILNEPLIEEGINKDELVEIKEDLTKPTNSAIEELMKILEEENAKLKELELPKAEKAAQDIHEKSKAYNESPEDETSDK